MTKYVLGFLFHEKTHNVCLILKNRPDFLAGKFNGIGGKIEKGERSKKAFIREFSEETGVSLHKKSVVKAIKIVELNYSISIFTGIYNDSNLPKTTESEHVEIFPLSDLPTNLCENVWNYINVCYTKFLLEFGKK